MFDRDFLTFFRQAMSKPEHPGETRTVLAWNLEQDSIWLQYGRMCADLPMSQKNPGTFLALIFEPLG